MQKESLNAKSVGIGLSFLGAAAGFAGRRAAGFGFSILGLGLYYWKGGIAQDEKAANEFASI